MKILPIAILLFFTSSLNGQLQIDEEYYSNGNLHWKGYKKTDTLSDGMTFTSQYGHYTYWYESGQLKMEIIYKKQRKDYRYVSMWTPDGTQILKEGRGVYYRIDNLYDNIDSTVYNVNDSILGSFSKYRKWPRDPKYDEYYLVSKGSSINGILEGMEWFSTPASGNQTMTTYKEGKKHGQYILKDNVDVVIEEGNYCEDAKCSEWKYYKGGILEKKVNYVAGIISGNYEEFYEDGKIKLKGQFRTEKRIVKAKVFSPDTYEEFIKEVEKEVSIKHGDWIYYNSKGEIIRTDKYN